MPRRKKQPQKKRNIREVEPSDSFVEQTKVSRFHCADGITFEVKCTKPPFLPPYHLGGFMVTPAYHDIYFPPKFSLYIDETMKCKILPCENNDPNNTEKKSQIKAYEGTAEIPFEILKFLASSKLFLFHTHIIKFVEGFFVDIYFDPKKFISLREASDVVISPQKMIMYRTIEYFLGITFDVYGDDEFYDEDQIDKIYNLIKNSYNPKLSSQFSHKAFIPHLRPYQCQAVSWMLEREKENSSTSSENDLHQLFTAVTLKDGHTLYFHKYGGFFVNQKYAPDSPCRGGLLADEMGLGKTLEILACILMNPRNEMDAENVNPEESIENSDKNPIIEPKKKEEPLDDDGFTALIESESPEPFGCHCGDRENFNLTARCKKCKIFQHPSCMLFRPEVDFSSYTCPFCLDKDLVSSRATLIISPASIINQWREEIVKHIKENSIKIFMYNGVEQQKYVDPKFLSDKDIVLVSYETLKKELSHVDIAYGPAGHSLRNVKRFLAIPSPLSSIEWWRICLDEAQMVENVTTNVAKMVGKLHSINRWCVSGTPMQKSIEDLYGLFVFLDVKPYNQKKWWNEAILKPFIYGVLDPLSSALNTIAWATTKGQVYEQIGLSEVKVITEELQFSAVERVYYNRKHSACKSAFMENISKYDDLDINLPCMEKRVLNQILQPMKTLQQICCHFQITQENLDMHKKRMTTSELLSKMVKNVTYECEQIHRQYVMACNGLAGIYMIEKDYKSAVEIFEKTLQSVEDNKEHIRTDASQQIHCLYHLSTALLLSEEKGEPVESKFKPFELNKKVNELSELYLEKSRIALSTCKKDFLPVKKDISNFEKQLQLQHENYPVSSWWSIFFSLLSDNQRKEILEKLPEALERANCGNLLKLKASTFLNSDMAFLDALLLMTSELHSERKKLLDAIEDLSGDPDVETMIMAVSCHLRPIAKCPKCKYCKAEDIFKSYESKLFIIEETTTIKHSENNFAEEIVTRHRKHASGLLEICLDHLYDYAHYFKNPDEPNDLYNKCSHDSAFELLLMATYKKEYQVLRNVWKKSYDYVSAKDEIEMAKMRVEMIPLTQKGLDTYVPYCLYFEEVQSNRDQYQSDIIEYNSRLKKKFGQLLYLKNLQKVENNEGPFQENCPVCQLKIDVTWFVLQCGHCVCINCTHQLKTRSCIINDEGTFKEGFFCPLCRQFNTVNTINLLVGKNEEREENIPLMNFYSTKINAVVRCLLQIKNAEPSAKSLVFSSLNGVLKILEDALAENGIKSFNFCNRKNFQEDLRRFKTMPSVQTLLIPLNFGCSGLNITEANHVIFLEPILDNALHHQAIGRAHRIGQKKQVTVHRFIIKDSIEQSIHATMSNSRQDKHNRTDLTLSNLKDLFSQDL